MTTPQCELYGGPLDGLKLGVPKELYESMSVIALPVNLSPADGFIKKSDIREEFAKTTAIYIRTSYQQFKFKEIDDGSTDITTYDGAN
jgi:hypothetical protein